MNDTQQRLMVLVGGAVLLLVLGGLIGWISHSLAMPTDKVATMAYYDDWRTACPPRTAKDGYCGIAQDIVDSRSGQEIARLNLIHQKDGNLQLVVSAPLDMLLQPGLGIALDKDKIRVYPYQTCFPSGCIATVPVDNQLLARLRSTKDAKLVLTLPNTKAVGLPFSLKGFISADDARQNGDARRTSWWRRLWT